MKLTKWSIHKLIVRDLNDSKLKQWLKEGWEPFQIDPPGSVSAVYIVYLKKGYT